MLNQPIIHSKRPSSPASASALDENGVRREFPILSRDIYTGVPLVYLDSAATSLKPNCVVDSLADHYRWHTANVHRGIHRLAEEVTERYERARELVAGFIHAPAAQQVIFTRGTTESINLVAWTWARHNVRSGDEIVVSEMEHHSNLVPWQQVASVTGAHLRFIPLTDDGQLDLIALDSLLSRKTKLVAVASVSNVLGTVNPVPIIVAMAHAVGARLLVDAAQSVPHMGTDVASWDCDFLAFSGHKMCGPDGVGVLYGKEELLEAMPPFLTGGQMVRRVGRTSADWNDLPWKFEAGTPPIGPAIGLGTAVEFLSHIGIEPIRRHDAELAREAFEELSKIDGLHLLGPAPEHRCSVVSFTVENIHPHDLSQVLDRRGIAIRAGHHCAHPLHTRLGIPASARASFYLYNTVAEVHQLAEGIREAQRLFHRRGN
jgi:cysteine desulfurase/selenocysteine lyase